jgi:Uma2 family endonuclease
MSTTTVPPRTLPADERVVLNGLGWSNYVKINDAVVQKPHVRMIYVDRRLTLLVTSRRHDWYAERLGELLFAVARELGTPLETAGSATFRSEEIEVGEGDRTYYLRDHAEIMKGPRNIDLSTQPPPDVAIEVEVSHPDNDALIAWGQIGVPEVWRLDAERWRFCFCQRQNDGSYQESARSTQLPGLISDDVLAGLRVAEDCIASDWMALLPDWVRGRLAGRPGRDNG